MIEMFDSVLSGWPCGLYESNDFHEEAAGASNRSDILSVYLQEFCVGYRLEILLCHNA